MFGYPSNYYYPQQYYQPQYTRRAAPSSSYSGFDPFSLGDTSSLYSRPTHRPQQHTSLNPYANPLSAYQRNSDDDTSSDEEEYLQQRPRRVAPQRQVRLDNPPEDLVPPQRQAKHPLKRHPQQAQQHPQHPQQPSQQHYQQAQQHPQHPQQTQQHRQQAKHPSQKAQPQGTHIPIHVQQQHAPKPVRKIDYDREARRIQRNYRGWLVRKHDIIGKLRTIKKIEGEVDEIVAAPIHQEILHLPLVEPLPNIDTHYVGKVPRCVVAFEYDLTTKLLALDEISGGTDVVRQARKALVAKIEGILARVDPVKKAYTNSPHHPPPKAEPMETTPTTSSTPTSSSTLSTNDAPSTTISEMETEEDTAEKKKQSVPIISDAPASTSGPSDAGTTSGKSFVDSMQSMNLSTPPSTPLPSSSLSASSSQKTASSVPPLKQLCFNLCDQLIKKAVHL